VRNVDGLEDDRSGAIAVFDGLAPVVVIAVDAWEEPLGVTEHRVALGLVRQQHRDACSRQLALWATAP
jgi:hypothetical protein